ncbi:ornithine carbamoyltransferase, partial [Globomyces pollinis-pini]
KNNQTFLRINNHSMRHFITLRDFNTTQILTMIRRSLELKKLIKANTSTGLHDQFKGKTLGMIFTKPSTRTRVSAETGWSFYGGHPLFLGLQDIQLGKGEPLHVTSKVVSSMVDCLLARVGDHTEIEELRDHSSVPVINALTATYHPLQILADVMTMYEEYVPDAEEPLPPLPPLTVTWIGDANNILNSMMVTYTRLGLRLKVATPKGYEVNEEILAYGRKFGEIEVYNDPLKAVKDSDVIVTDTWVSMGQESEKQARLEAFQGYQVSEEMAKAGQAKASWKFMHCLPRKEYEVNDEVFYGNRSIVYREAENRKYTVMSVYEYVMNSSSN